MQINRELQAYSYLANTLVGAADLHLLIGKLNLVESPLDEALHFAKASDDQKTVSAYWLELGRLHLARGLYQAAHAAFEKLDEIAHQLSMPARTAQALTLMGAASLGLGKIEVARRETSSAIRQLEMLGAVTTDVQPQAVWWWRYQALKDDGRPKTKDRRRETEDRKRKTEDRISDEAWPALQTAYAAMLKNIATLSDEGLRRNYLNKVKLNRDILIEWIKQAIDRGIPTESSIPRSINLQSQFRRLVSIGVRLNEPREVDALLDFIMEQLIELSGAERALLILASDQGARSIAASRGYPEKEEAAALKDLASFLDEVARKQVALLREQPSAVGGLS